MAHQPFESCLEACNQCAAACHRCVTACLQEPDPRSMARCIALDLDCAAICELAAGVIARASEHAQAVCSLCADICESCGEECARHPLDQCRQCAEQCRHCAEECRRMSQQAVTRAGQAAGAHTH